MSTYHFAYYLSDSIFDFLMSMIEIKSEINVNDINKGYLCYVELKNETNITYS